MSSISSTPTLRPDFASIFEAALESYRRRTKIDLESHPLFSALQYCDSPEATLSVFREQIPAYNRFQNIDDRFTKWVIPTVNVLHALSDNLGPLVGLTFPPANIIFTGIGVLLSAANDASACQDKLIDVFSRIERFFQRLEIYTSITLTTAMLDMVVDIMVEVINIMAIATKEAKSRRFKLWLKKLMGNSDVEDSLGKLEKLFPEEAQMAQAEQLNVTHSVKGTVVGIDIKVKSIDNKVEGIGEEVQGIRDDVKGVGNKVQSIEESVQAVKDDVKDVGSGMRVVGGDIKDISSEVRNLDNKLDEVKRNQLRRDLLRWLSPPNPSVNHNIASKACHNGTAQWFFQGNIFKEWKSAGSFLWVHGKPGSGKSVLCSSIIQDIMTLHHDGRASMAYFYFDFRDVNKQKLCNLLPSLLIQLSARSNPCRVILSRLLSAHDHGSQKPSDRAMVECLKEMLSLEALGPTYVIIDALDECPISSDSDGGPSPREEVLEFIDELVGLHLPNLHICVTSRPELDIRVVLEGLTKQPVSLHDESGQQEDIAKYVSSFVHSNQKMRRWRDEDKDLVIKTLSKKADGMFRWVYCQLDVLRYCLPSSVKRILDDLPESLDETYERILREIEKPNQEHALRLLQCLVVSVRPLKVEELAQVLVFDFDEEGIPKPNLDWRWEDQEEAIMSSCSSLVIIVKDGDSRIVQFSHFSVKEFLTSKRLAEPIRDVSRYHIQLEAAHTILVRACLGTLLQSDRPDYSAMVRDFPLFPYAARYWDTHALFENVSSRVKDGIGYLFDTDRHHFTAWLYLDRPDISFESRCSMWSMTPSWGLKPRVPPLYIAARLGILVAVEYIVAKHPWQMKSTNEKRETPTHAAVDAGHIDILLFLLKNGADTNARNSNDYTPLHVASLGGKLEAGKCLLEHGADVNALGSHVTPLHLAALRGHSEVVQMLLEHGSMIDRGGIFSEPPLFGAIRDGRTQIVELLLEYGADPSGNDFRGNTLVELATKWKQPEVLEILYKYGAKLVE